jgi:hypothetical protein
MCKWEGDGLSSSPQRPAGFGGVSHRGHGILSPPWPPRAACRHLLGLYMWNVVSLFS